MGVSTVLVVALQVGVIFGQAPFLKTENQCGALFDRKLFHVCSAGVSLRSARADTPSDPFADAVMNNAQTLLDKAATMLGRTPPNPAAKEATSVFKSSASDAKPTLVAQLKHAAQTLSVSSCIIQNSVDILNDAIRALEVGGVQPLQQDATQPPPPPPPPVPAQKPVDVPIVEVPAVAVPAVEVPVVEVPVVEVPVVEVPVVKPAVVKDPVADPPIAAPSRPRPQGGRPPVSVDVQVFANGKPVDVHPHIEISESSNSGPYSEGSSDHGPPPNDRPPQVDDPLPAAGSHLEESLTGMDKLNYLNEKVHTLSKQVADLLSNLGVNLMKPVRSQSFHKLARAPLEEIQQIQVVLARSDGAEMDDEVEAEAVVRDLQRQQEMLQRLLDSPEELKEKLLQPKDRNVSQALVTDLRALKKTLTLVLPLPQDFY